MVQSRNCTLKTHHSVVELVSRSESLTCNNFLSFCSLYLLYSPHSLQILHTHTQRLKWVFSTSTVCSLPMLLLVSVSQQSKIIMSFIYKCVHVCVRACVCVCVRACVYFNVSLLKCRHFLFCVVFVLSFFHFVFLHIYCLCHKQNQLQIGCIVLLKYKVPQIWAEHQNNMVIPAFSIQIRKLNPKTFFFSFFKQQSLCSSIHNSSSYQKLSFTATIWLQTVTLTRQTLLLFVFVC